MSERMIREAHADDWASMGSIYIEGIEGNRATFTRTCPTYEQWDVSHLEFGRFVMCCEGVICGWIALSPFSGVPAYRGVAEFSLYVANGYHREGIGEALLRHLIPDSEAHGIWTLYAKIMADNEASVRLAEKCGFRTIGYQDRIARDRFDQWRSIILMERRSRCEF